MKITYTQHALNKKVILNDLGWNISLALIEKTILQPQVSGLTKQEQPTAISYLGSNHILRIVYEIRDGIIVVVTIHISTKGRYGT